MTPSTETPAVQSGAAQARPASGPPAPPAPAVLPVLTPCPSGWAEVGAEPIVCEPWPGGPSAACAVDEARFVGEPGCTRVGSACGADDWAADLPAGRPILYVRAGTAPGGDGSRARPFSSIWAAASPGTLIALSKGTHDLAAPLPSNATLWGA